MWKDVNEYQKIEYAEVILTLDTSDIFVEDYVFTAVENIKKAGCHIENFQITDTKGKIYSYSI